MIFIPWGLSGKEFTCQCRRHGFNTWVRKTPWRREWLPTPVFLPRGSHTQWSLAGYSTCSRKESDVTERLSTYTICVRATHLSRNRSSLYVLQKPERGREEAGCRRVLASLYWEGPSELPHRGAPALRPGAIAQSPGREAALCRASLPKACTASSVRAREGAGCGSVGVVSGA